MHVFQFARSFHHPKSILLLSRGIQRVRETIWRSDNLSDFHSFLLLADFPLEPSGVLENFWEQPGTRLGDFNLSCSFQPWCLKTNGVLTSQSQTLGCCISLSSSSLPTLLQNPISCLNHLSFAGTYFNCIMMMVASSVVLTVVVLNYHHRSVQLSPFKYHHSTITTGYCTLNNLVRY